MSVIAYFLLSFLAPWILGTVISLACLKKRYGYFTFALGSGYLLGMLISVAVVKLSNGFLATDNSFTWPIGQIILAVLIAVFYPAKRCTIEEQRLEKAPSNVAYFMSLGVIILLTARLALIYNVSFELPTDYNEAKIIIADLNLLSISSMWDPQHDWLVNLQTSATALQKEYHYLSSIPFLSIAVAMSFIIFGGLRYLGCKLLPAVLATYMVMSLPQLSESLEQKMMLVVIMSAFYLFFMVLSIIVVNYSEGRLWPMLAVILLALSNHHYLFVVACASLLLIIVFKYAGFLISLVTASVLIASGYLHFVTDFSSKNLEVTQFLSVLYENIFKSENWHILGISILLSLIFLIFSRKRHDGHAMAIFVMASLAAVLSSLGLIYFGQQQGVANTQFVTQSVLLFAPFICLISVAVYNLITFDKDTLSEI